MLRVIEKHGGLLDKFIGDGALVVFGPDPKDDGATAAVACAREMVGALVAHNAERSSRGTPPLAIGIGIHTGAVISGVIGAGTRLEWTVIGDAVNTAARLEGLTKEEKVIGLVSAQTVAKLARPGELRDLGERTVRRRSERVRLYALESSQAAAEIAKVAI